MVCANFLSKRFGENVNGQGNTEYRRTRNISILRPTIPLSQLLACRDKDKRNYLTSRKIRLIFLSRTVVASQTVALLARTTMSATTTGASGQGSFKITTFTATIPPI